MSFSRQMKKASLLFLLFCQICQAEPVRFEQANFSIDIPATWKEAEAPPHVLGLYRSADNSKGITLITAEFSEKDAPTALEQMVSGAKGAAQKSNVPVTGEHDKVIDGVNFRVYSMTMPGNVTVQSMTGVVGLRGYSIQGFSGVSDPAKDPEMASMLGSFRLLAKSAAPLSPAPSAPPRNEAYEFGQKVGRLSFFALIGGAIIVVVRRSFRRAK